MLKGWTRLVLSIAIILMVGATQTSAESPPIDEEVFSYIQEAFQVQISLGEKHRPLSEIQSLLDPYFTSEYQEKFLAEHLFKEKEGYITYGTDFAVFYIPFFTYDEKTKIHMDEQSGIITVYEFFKGEAGMPSLYDDHYEFIQLKETNEGWKVVEYGTQKEEPSFLSETASLETTTHQSKENTPVKMVSNDRKQSEKKIFFSFRQLTRPLAIYAFNNADDTTFAFYQAMPMFASPFFMPNKDESILAAR